MFLCRSSITLFCATLHLASLIGGNVLPKRIPTWLEDLSADGSVSSDEMETYSAELVKALKGDESDGDEFREWNKCDKVLAKLPGIKKYFHSEFLKKLVLHLNPFFSEHGVMRFYLFRHEFRDCGREMNFTKDSVLKAGLNPNQPTRIIIHGWMTPSRGSFNRDLKEAYLKRGNFNVIVSDWSATAANPNYFAVTELIEGLGLQLAQFTEHLHDVIGVQFDDIYLIGHSLGAQIAGAAGKRIRPEQYNTIFALDPAGPTFRHRDDEFRIDPTDARYVESIQTSANLGFLEPRGNATFYPNRGVIQRNCYLPGCSHLRAYKMFAESINSPIGFWGTRCERHKDRECVSVAATEAKTATATNGDTGTTSKRAQPIFFRMGGEPSVPKSGLFEVKTNYEPPFALGKVL